MVSTSFQPTRPLRGATWGWCFIWLGILYFNPRAPCGARLGTLVTKFMNFIISTHAPLAGRDEAIRIFAAERREFQPTRPLRGATKLPNVKEQKTKNFNPRAPCGARQEQYRERPSSAEFQPTRPLRGATIIAKDTKKSSLISTHAPLAGRDVVFPTVARIRKNFNPRAPCGARRERSCLIDP